MAQQRPLLDLEDHHAIIANKRGGIATGQRLAIEQFLSTVITSAIVSALPGQARTPWGFRYLHQVKYALDRGQIATTECSIGPDGQLHPGTLAASPPALRFPTWSSTPGGLRPGPYRLHYLPGVDFVIAAECLAPDEARPASRASAPLASDVDGGNRALGAVLARVNGFDLAALPTNRAGRLSANQQRTLLAAAGRRRVQSLLGAGMCLLMASYIVVAVLTGQVADGSSIWVGAIGLIAGVAGALLLRNRHTYGNAVRAGRVIVVEGYGRRMKEPRTMARYAYHVGMQRFYVSKPAYDAFVEQVVYRAYCLPQVYHLVNIEPVLASAAITEAARLPELRAQTID